MPKFSRKHFVPYLAPIPAPAPASFYSNEDSDIGYIVNHMNDNLKILFYLVDADKLKKVQNILFSKHSRMSRKTHTSRMHHSMSPTKSKRFHQGMPTVPAIPPHYIADLVIPRANPLPAQVPRMPRAFVTDVQSPVPAQYPLQVQVPVPVPNQFTGYQQHIKHKPKIPKIPKIHKLQKLTKKQNYNQHNEIPNTNSNYSNSNHSNHNNHSPLEKSRNLVDVMG